MIFGGWFRSRDDKLYAEAKRKVKYLQEQAERPRTKVEIFARAYCEALGYDPDSAWFPGPMMPAVKRWMKYRDVAEGALHEEARAAGLAALPKDTARA